MDPTKRVSRRKFLKRGGAAALGGITAPLWVRTGLLAGPEGPGANEEIRLGFIGSGHRARLLMDQIPKGARIVAICDVDLQRCAQALKEKGASWRVHQDYRAILEAKDIDAVVVPTTDHGRVLPCIHACQAGKDIYAEKPLTLTIHEGRILVEHVRKHKRVLQVGSQQRSMEMNRFACELVRTGGLGRLQSVLGCNYPGPGEIQPFPEEKVPETLNWDRWCGQTELRPYSPKIQFGWMGFRSFSGGEMTNWGAHGLDQVQWALGMDSSGPVEVWTESPGPNGKVSLRYASGVVVKLELANGPMGGAVFIGERGKIEIDRNRFTATPAELVKNPPEPQKAAIWEGPGWQAKYHIQNWLDCIKSRARPVADVEIGHRSITVCHLANIARQLGRKLRWDPAKERFIGDEEADGYLERPKRKGYQLPDPV
jgi:predicted dehydrogenase